MITGAPARSNTRALGANYDVNSKSFYKPNQRESILRQDNYTIGIVNPKGFLDSMADESFEDLRNPSVNIVLETYRSDIINERRAKNRGSNEINRFRQKNSFVFDSDDSIQILLLMETALSDSKEFEILPQKEAEEMRLKCKTITQQIEQTRKDLIIQLKYRDATASVARLYSPRLSNQKTSETLQYESKVQDRQNELDLLSNEKRCEELAIRLFHLERELMTPQERLLRHTAGVLQLTHKSTQNLTKPLGNPEDMYTFTESQSNFESINDNFLFDERSLYRALEGTDGSDEGLGPASKIQMEIIHRAEKKIMSLNHKLSKIICRVNPDSKKTPDSPPIIDEKNESLDILQNYLEILEQNVNSIDFEQDKIEIDYSKVISENNELREQKNILQRQIRQQRDQQIDVSNSSAETQLKEKNDELEKIKSLHTQKIEEIDNLKKQISSLNEKLADAQQREVVQKQLSDERNVTDLHEAEKNIKLMKERIQVANEKIRETEEKVRTAEEASRVAVIDLESRDQCVSRLEAQLQSVNSDHASENAALSSKNADLETQIMLLREELASANSTIGTLSTTVKEKEAQLADKEREIDETQMDIARLQTEVTIAKAELDGAFGSRAQRAANMAASAAVQKEIEELTNTNDSLIYEMATLKTRLVEAETRNDEIIKNLRKELSETIDEYEKMTKASIQWGKERDQFEEIIDSLREAKEELEAQIIDEKVRWIGIQSPDSENLSPVSTSTTVLKNEFKKMMRDLRAENSRLLRAEQLERRRLEEEIRTLKKTRLNP